jgi:SNF2 family DNA or RNA helicase/uncharacterized Zn finger protein
MRKSYGNTWWGKEWLNSLKNIDNSNRLPRGKTYANKGAAYDIDIIGNKISAKVSGSRRTPYKVNFSIPEFTASTKAKIIGIITDNPLHLSKLLNRELPHQLDDDCQRKGIRIFPRSWSDMKGGCSCPDFAVPCKHMAAVLYMVANEIDKNPFVVLQLRGFDLFKALEGVGYSIGKGKEIQTLTISDVWQDYSYREGGEIWNEHAYQQIDLSTIPPCKDNILTILSEKPSFFPHGDFKNILTKAYTNVAKGIIKEDKLRDKEEQNSSLIMDNTEQIEIIMDDDFNLMHVSLRNNKGKRLIEFKEIQHFIKWIASIPLQKSNYYAAPLRGLILAYHFSKRLAINSAIIPQLFRIGIKHNKIRWIPALLNEEVNFQCREIEQFIPKNLVFYKTGKDIYEPTKEDYLNSLLSIFLGYFMNEHHNLSLNEQSYEINSLFFNSNVETFDHFETREFPITMQLWLNRFYIADKTHIPVLLVEEVEEGFKVTINIEDKSKPLDLIPLDKLLEDNKYSHIRISILRDLALLSDYFPEINQVVATGGKTELIFDSEEFVDILFKILPVIKLFGVKVFLPKALRKLMRPQLSMSLETEESGVVKKTSIINMDDMLSFHWKVAVGDQKLTATEFLKMVKKYSGIVKLNDAYVYFDEKEIKQLISKLNDPPKINGNQLFQAALTEEYEGATIELGAKAKKMMGNLLNSKKTTLPKGLNATLRPYQKRGFEWLYKNSKLGFGSIIADDMGLGKTIQIITTLLKLKEDGLLKTKKALVVVPTTLLTNWDKEIKKFAPSLSSHIYHGPNRDLAPLKEADLLITTYGVARSDVAKLQKEKWLTLIIDEAQNIKNPGTAQTKAIKKINAPIKIAMSGTPVENRLSEYWSLFDFSNKSYLGTLSKFKDNFAKPIEIDRDQAQMDRFMKITSPFILRRLKSDKSIIKDLPDKIEKDQYCDLTKEQAAIYQNVVDTTMKSIASLDGIKRRGMVLKLITSLKQICNHPRQFLKKGDSSPTLSGKAMLLIDLLQQILDNGEKTIIFTQYQEMGALIGQMIEEQFGIESAFLHGGVSRKKRDEMVDNFQNNRSERILILSLKAGGTGLNLTAANNVIHYDLWWNPAVEAQATDRAYRIGQKKNVMVHRFITKGSFEEKINKLILDKKELANLTVSTGEKWIGDFSNDELKDMMKLDLRS